MRRTLIGVVARNFTEFKRLFNRHAKADPEVRFIYLCDVTRMRGFRGEIQLWGDWMKRKDFDEIHKEIQIRTSSLIEDSK